jgi:adhesin transport system outer membrane protein
LGSATCALALWVADSAVARPTDAAWQSQKRAEEPSPLQVAAYTPAERLPAPPQGVLETALPVSPAMLASSLRGLSSTSPSWAGPAPAIVYAVAPPSTITANENVAPGASAPSDRLALGAVTAARLLPAPVPLTLPSWTPAQFPPLRNIQAAQPPAPIGETLTIAVRDALNANPEILIAEAKRDEARYGRGEARAALLPSVDLVGKHGSEALRPEGEDAFVEHTRSETSVNLRQNVWDFGAAWNSYRSADSTAQSEEWSYRAQVDGVALQIAGAFHDTLERQELVRLAEQNVAAHEQILATVQSQRDFGMVTGADVSRVEGRLNAARSDLLDRRSALAQAKENYRRLLNREPGPLATPPSVDAALPLSVDDAIAELQKRNPNVMRALMLRRALQQQRAAQRAGFLPRIDLELEAASRENAGSENGRNEEQRAMLAMRVPLFDGGARQASTGRTAARIRQAEFQVQRTLRDAEQAVRNDYSALQAAKDKISAIEAEVAASERLTALYAEQFKTGSRSVFDLLDGQQSLYTALARRETNRKEVRLSGYRVLATLGSLFPTIEAAEAPKDVALASPLPFIAGRPTGAATYVARPDVSADTND